MRTTIDSAGRVVVPKPLRQALGLEGGAEIEIEIDDAGLRIDVPPTPMRLEPTDYGVRAVSSRDLPPLTAKSVRETLERLRR